MTRNFIALLFLAMQTIVLAQHKLPKLASFSSELEEISGMHLDTKQQTLWAINDAGNKNIVYGLNPETADIKWRVYFEDTPNIDWEDLAWDGKETLFIGDFGNNKFKRRFFTIYGLKPLAGKAKSVAPTVATRVEFPDNAKKKGKIRFDVEGLIYWNGDFYLFTKTRNNKYKDCTSVYCVAAKSGVQQAKYLGDIALCDNKSDCKITGAAMHHNTGTLALISHKNLFLFKNFNAALNFDNQQVFKFKKDTQKEAVTFVNATTVLISEEQTKGPNYLYSFSWK